MPRCWREKAGACGESFRFEQVAAALKKIGVDHVLDGRGAQALSRDQVLQAKKALDGEERWDLIRILA